MYINCLWVVYSTQSGSCQLTGRRLPLDINMQVKLTEKYSSLRNNREKLLPLIFFVTSFLIFQLQGLRFTFMRMTT